MHGRAQRIRAGNPRPTSLQQDNGGMSIELIEPEMFTYDWLLNQIDRLPTRRGWALVALVLALILFWRL